MLWNWRNHKMNENEIEFIDILQVDDELKEKVRQWRNKEEIRKCMLNQDIISREEHFKWLEGLKRREDWKFWVIFVNKIPIGSIYLQNINYRELTSEWGFYIGEESYRGKGLSKCILFNLLKIFFDKMKFKTLFTKILPNNTVALNLYKKFKFKEIDKLPFKNKKEVILLKFSREDWEQFREEFYNGPCYKIRK